MPPPHCSAVLPDRTSPADTPVVLRLPAYPVVVPSARRCVTGMLAGLVPSDHLDDLVLCTAELMTNALAAALRYAEVMKFGWSHYDTPIHLGVLASPTWTRLDVRDPEPYMQPASPAGLLDDGGRGLGIVEMLGGHLGTTFAAGHKVMHAVLPISGELDAADLIAAFPAGARRR